MPLQNFQELLDQRRTEPCGCIGPQNGEPVCPCRMRDVTVKDGRYVRVQDLGPAPNGGLRHIGDFRGLPIYASDKFA